MKLCFISTFPPTPCGIATYSNYLIDNLLKITSDIDIVVLAEKGGKQIDSGVKVYPCFARNENYYVTIINQLKELTPEIVHIQHEFGIFGEDDRFITLLKDIKSLGIKLVLTLHTVHTNQISSDDINCESYERKIAEECDLIIIHLDSSMKKVLERIGINPKKLKVIPHGTQKISKINKLEARKKLGLPAYGKILLSFGFVRKLKDELTIINSLPLIKKHVPDVFLFIAGNPQPNRQEDVEYLNKCKNRVKMLNLEETVIFSEKFIGEKDLSCVFSACDVCVFTYKDEYRSASGSFHLAVGAEKPVVLSRIPKFEEEAILNISDEIMILPQSSDSFAKVAIRLLTDEKFYNYIKQKVKKFAVKTSWYNVAKKHLKAYYKLLSR